MTRLLPLALLLFLPATDAMAAEIYKCRQADGSITYSDTPCPDATSTEKLDIESQPTDPADVEERRHRRRAQIEALQERDARAAEEAQSSAAEKAEREQLCQKAREQLERLLTENRIYVTENGERRYLDSEELVQRREKARAQVEELCN